MTKQVSEIKNTFISYMNGKKVYHITLYNSVGGCILCLLNLYFTFLRVKWYGLLINDKSNISVTFFSGLPNGKLLNIFSAVPKNK